jgi:NAD(P)-dependent dehydrogenase (short-subunit alcohol dehydrogenase family)
VTLEDDIARLFRLDGRVAIVTGASSGLGHRFARVLAAAGAHVVAAARRADLLEALATECGALAVPCDLTNDDEVQRLVAIAVAHWGRIDVLVNNAGVTVTVPAEDEPLDTFRSVLDLNVSALFRVTQLVGRHMLEQRSGSVVNVASAMGFVAAAPLKQASYTASKGAVINLTRELAVQWARKGVRVNALGPGFFPTEMTASMLDDERSMSWVRSNSPIPRFGEEHELDGALLFLASDASSYCTGQTIVVDGGWTAR